MTVRVSFSWNNWVPSTYLWSFGPFCTKGGMWALLAIFCCPQHVCIERKKNLAKGHFHWLLAIPRSNPHISSAAFAPDRWVGGPLGESWGPSISNGARIAQDWGGQGRIGSPGSVKKEPEKGEGFEYHRYIRCFWDGLKSKDAFWGLVFLKKLPKFTLLGPILAWRRGEGFGICGQARMNLDVEGTKSKMKEMEWPVWRRSSRRFELFGVLFMWNGSR